MHAVFARLFAWLVSGAVVKGVVVTAVFGVVALLVPKVIDLVSPFVGVPLGTAFSGLPNSITWVLSAFSISTGIPVVISAYVARFLIRRIPFIG